MEMRICIEPQQGAAYADISTLAAVSETSGFQGFYVSDHFHSMPFKHAASGGRPGPTDAWTTLAGLARDTSTIGIGTLLTSATFRHPVVLAITVAQVDAMSGGRVNFGLGAGWFALEHDVHGLPFPPVGERFDRLEEQLQVILGMWQTPEGETFTFSGEHYAVHESPALPKPLQRPHPPVVIGGSGPRRTPSLAARFASEFNAPFVDPEVTSARLRVIDRACEAIGRDPATLRRSGGVIICCGESVAEARARAVAIDLDPASEDGGVLIGTVEEVVDRLGAYEAIGADAMYLEIDDLSDLDHVRLLGERVLPALS
jgi:F420-dependent oxidoreductase-like protein